MTTVSPDDARPRSLGDAVRHGMRALANPVSFKGVLAIVGGSLILLMPNVTTAVVELIAIVGTALTAVIELVFAVSGRWRLGSKRNRFWAGLRGLAALAFALFLGVLAVAGPSVGVDGSALGLSLVVLVLGVYLMVRGALLAVSAWRDTGATYRHVRLSAGIAGIAFGALATTAPSLVSTSLIVALAVFGVLVGALFVVWGFRQVDTAVPTIDPATATIPEVLWDWIHTADVGDERRADLSSTMYLEAPERSDKRLAWWTMLVLSVAIATYAVLGDSTAVVIGAMLVAPLMVPILGLAGAIVNGWRHRALSSAVLVAMGVGVAIALSYGLSAWAPVTIAFDTNTQIVSRVDPTVLDMLIAIAAGAAGAFATVDKRVSSSIAGVAIAVALVPPLSVVGICLGGGRPDDALGAFLLFLTNFVAIVLAAAAVFVLTGFARPDTLRENIAGVLSTVIPFIAVAALILMPLFLTSEGLLDSATRQSGIQAAVEEWLGDDDTLLIESITSTADSVTVSLTGTGTPPPLESLQNDLRTALATTPDVTVRVTPVTETTLTAD